jgi:hypothetical protein
MKEIELTKGYKALVDDEDFEIVSAYGWYAMVETRNVYAARKARREDGKRYNLYLHRFLMKVTDRKIEVDHSNHNGLDCQKHNLRVVTHLQNGRNRRKLKGFSQHKGVVWNKEHEKWTAGIMVNGEAKFLGGFAFETDAALAYDAAAREHFGEFAHTNFNA